MRLALCLIAVLVGALTSPAFGQVEVERVLVPIWFPQPLPGALGSLWKTEIAILNSTYERILLPVFLNPGVELPGAFGSRWVTDLVGFNDSARHVKVTQTPLFACGLPEGCPQPADAKSTFRMQLNPPTSQGLGQLLYVERAGSQAVTFNLRIQDLSRQSLTWGTELPVVRESDVFSTSLILLNVPLESRFRQALRIYDFDGELGRTVRLRIYEGDSSPALVDSIVSLGSALPAQEFPERPGQAQIGDLVIEFTQLLSADRVRIQIDPSSPGVRFWAFLSITNDETQHVTTITPQ